MVVAQGVLCIQMMGMTECGQKSKLKSIPRAANETQKVLGPKISS